MEPNQRKSSNRTRVRNDQRVKSNSVMEAIDGSGLWNHVISSAQHREALVADQV